MISEFIAPQITSATAAEVLALAMTNLFPHAQLLAGGVDGMRFYYDFAIEQHVAPALIPRIEELIRAELKADHPIRILEMMRENAAQLFIHRNQAAKAELIALQPWNVVPIFAMGDFRDLACGDYLPSTAPIVSIRILEILKVPFYLEGFDRMEATRVYAVVVPEKKAFKILSKKIEAAKKNDHRLLGREMDLYTVDEDVDALDVHWKPRGVVLREVLLDFWRQQHRLSEYFPARCNRFIVKELLQKEEGKNAALPSLSVDGGEQVFAPRAATHHAQLFKDSEFSASDLPVRYAECVDLCSLHPLERLSGLLRSRTYTADSVSIFCSAEQVVTELISSLQFISQFLIIPDVEHRWILSRKSEKSPAKQWAQGTQWMEAALQACGICPVTVEPSSAFDQSLVDAPQLELHLMDPLGRQWCISRLSLNFYLPARFGLCYQGDGGTRHRPIMIQRSAFVSLERTIALLIELYGGLLPFWLAPEQLRVIPVTEANSAYASELLLKLQQQGYRAKIDRELCSLGAKIHAAECARVPYALIIGDREQKDRLLSIRRCGGQTESVRMSLENFLETVLANELPKS